VIIGSEHIMDNLQQRFGTSRVIALGQGIFLLPEHWWWNRQTFRGFQVVPKINHTTFELPAPVGADLVNRIPKQGFVCTAREWSGEINC
jgi:ABC-type sulfate transport system permease component